MKELYKEVFSSLKDLMRVAPTEFYRALRQLLICLMTQ